jgi:anti-repressor protein
MKNMLSLKEELTMSSREIAELVESRHDKVKQSIERLAERGIVTFTPMGEKSKGGRPGTEYLVNKRDSYVVVAQLCPEFTARLVDRWQELESKNLISLPDFTNPAIAARAWADEVEAKQAALKQIEADKPKVEFAMAVRNMQGACSVGEFAKTIGTGRNRLFKQMRDDGILMANNQPYQRYIDQGLFVVIEQIPYTDSKGKTYPAFTTMITGKGQVWLESKYRGVFGKKAA